MRQRYKLIDLVALTAFYSGLGIVYLLSLFPRKGSAPLVDDEGRPLDRSLYYDDFDWTLDTFSTKK